MPARLVDRASFVGDVVVVYELKRAQPVSTMTSLIIHRTGDDDLGGDVDIRPLCLACNFDAVGQGRGRSVGPAGSAVLGDVLVPQVSKVVDTIDIVPDEVLRERHY